MPCLTKQTRGSDNVCVKALDRVNGFTKSESSGICVAQQSYPLLDNAQMNKNCASNSACGRQGRMMHDFYGMGDEVVIASNAATDNADVSPAARSS